MLFHNICRGPSQVHFCHIWSRGKDPSMPGFPNKAVSGLSLLLRGSRRTDRVMEGCLPGWTTRDSGFCREAVRERQDRFIGRMGLFHQIVSSDCPVTAQGLYKAIQPPSTGKMTPCTKSEAGEAKNSADPAMSSISPHRPAGVLLVIALFRP